MPKTIEAVGQSVYRALRKADIVAFEISASESGLPAVPKPQRPISSDPQSQELFQVADRNIAEYQLGMEAVMGGVQRSEAQAAGVHDHPGHASDEDAWLQAGWPRAGVA